MGFSIKGYDLPFIRNYKQAKQHYDSIKPIRGSNNLRPLGDRRKQHQRIEEARPNFSGAAGIACVLYHTQCVTYYEDGTIHLQHGGYISQSTCKFIERIAPVTHVRMDKQRDCLVVRVAGGEYKCGDDGLWLKLDERGGYEPFDYKPFKVTSVNRKAMREVRKQYAAFMAYVVGLGKLTQWERPEGGGASTRRFLDAMEDMRGDDLEKWAELYPRLVCEAGTSGCKFDWATRSYVRTRRCDEKRVVATMTDLIKREHASEVLVREPLPDGVHKKDPNHKYVRYMH